MLCSGVPVETKAIGMNGNLFDVAREYLRSS
jgi:hypothetical protein